ncbi:hypothetical protein SynWH8103_00681 [Synechococcus sp. WH 8103]|nr:hypothetical protein [Parasynechococcus marenigrum]CRY91422.1 hypothetical protein SynWH8103_00681 [Synechococcus sp. WH 8103]
MLRQPGQSTNDGDAAQRARAAATLLSTHHDNAVEESQRLP